MSESEDTLILDRPLDLTPGWADFFRFTWDEKLKELVACHTARLQFAGCMLSLRLKGLGEGVRKRMMSAEILYMSPDIFPLDDKLDNTVVRELLRLRDEKKHCR